MLGLVAAGATILIISGDFDISVGAIIGLAAVIMAMIVRAGYPEELAMLAGLAFALARVEQQVRGAPGQPGEG